MSDSLLDQLEAKLMAAVDSIEGQRREIEELREERQLLEDALKEERQVMEEKLRGLISRLDQAGEPPLAAQEAASEAQSISSSGGSAAPYSGGGKDY